MAASRPQAIRAALLGASGMVGFEVLHVLFQAPEVESIAAIGRKPLGVAHPKLREILHADFLDFKPLAPLLAETDLWFHCIGVYQGMVPEAEFWKVTCDYLAALLRDLQAVRTDATFCLFSAQGADPSEKSRLLFARAKGRAERLLSESQLARRYVFRPGYIDPGRRRAKSRIPVWFARPFYRLLPFLGIGAADLAKVMVDAGLHGSERTLFENRDLRRAAKALSRP